MNPLETVLSSGKGGFVRQLTSQFGITSDQATSVMSALLPALAEGVQQKLANGGASALQNVISGGSLSKFENDPASLATPAALDQGKSLLNQIFGSGDLSKITSMVAEKAGVSSAVVNGMLPIAATVLGAVLSKSATDGQGNLTQSLSAIANAVHSGILSAVRNLGEKVFR